MPGFKCWKELCFVLLCGLFSAPLLQAEVTSYTTSHTAGKYLSIPTGSRPAALGQAFNAISGDINAIDWNPAGLSELTGSRLMLAHHAWITGINQESAYYAQAIEYFGVAGLKIAYLNYGPIERWLMDESENPIPTGDQYTPYVLSGSVCWAVPVGEKITVGAGINLHYEQIDNVASLASALDLGVQYHWQSDLTLGASLRHLGIVSNDYLLPMTLGLGAGYTLPLPETMSAQNHLLAVTEISIKHDDLPVWGMGLEYTYHKLLTLRIGWNQNFGHTNTNRIGITAGAGITYQNWILDYAIAPQGDLGISHQVSVQYEF